MRVILFGASGMVGQGVLRECLLDPDVKVVLAVGRSAASVPGLSQASHAKLQNVKLPKGADFSLMEDKLAGYDACFFCLGISSAGLSEPAYRQVTYDLTLGAARTLSRVNPGMTFIYVSGAGTDRSGKSRSMWARVKGETENALLKLPFKAAYMFRPGFIQPLDGIQSKTKSYRILYALTEPLFPLLRWLFPGSTTDTRQIGQAMLRVAREGYTEPVLEAINITACSR
jgi:uncharacterized protein YbjT (DUF2867 family)